MNHRVITRLLTSSLLALTAIVSSSYSQANDQTEPKSSGYERLERLILGRGINPLSPKIGSRYEDALRTRQIIEQMKKGTSALEDQLLDFDRQFKEKQSPSATK